MTIKKEDLPERRRVMNREVKKWTGSAAEVIARLEETLAHGRKQLKHNQRLFNEAMHKETFNCELAYAYIMAMNSTIDAINSLEQLLKSTQLGKDTS